MYLSQNQEYNITEDDNLPTTDIKTFNQPKFIKALNSKQNCIKWRQRRIKQRRKLTQLKSIIYQKFGNQFLSIVPNKELVRSNDIKPSTEIIYKGHQIKSKFKKNFLHGDTQIVYENGVQFNGVYKNGKMRNGKFNFHNGYEYWGQLDGKMFMGKGTLKCPDGKRITGVWNSSVIQGRAQIQYPSGDIYYGQIKNFLKHGQGYLFFNSGNKYIGHFNNGKIDGLGVYFSNNDGTVDKGIWKNGQLIQKVNQYSNEKLNSSQKIQKQQEKKIQVDGVNQLGGSQKILRNIHSQDIIECLFQLDKFQQHNDS